MTDTAVCAADANGKDPRSIRSDRSCRHVLLLTAASSELLEVAPQIRDFLVALDTGKDHLGTRDLSPRISDVFLERVFVPGNAGVLVGVAVTEVFNSARLATIKSIEDRSNLIGGVFANAMTGGAFSE